MVHSFLHKRRRVPVPYSDSVNYLLQKLVNVFLQAKIGLYIYAVWWYFGYGTVIHECVNSWRLSPISHTSNINSAALSALILGNMIIIAKTSYRKLNGLSRTCACISFRCILFPLVKTRPCRQWLAGHGK